jgi:hypothetical protein
VNSAAKKQATWRLVLAGLAYLVVAGVAVLLFWPTGGTTVTVTHVVIGGGTYTTHMLQVGRSVYQENPGPVTVILLLMFAAVTTSTLSVVYRIKKRSPKLGIAGMLVAGLAGIFCVLGALTVGPFVLPLAGLLVVLALPMTKLSAEPAPPTPESRIG